MKSKTHLQVFATLFLVLGFSVSSLAQQNGDFKRAYQKEGEDLDRYNAAIEREAINSFVLIGGLTAHVGTLYHGGSTGFQYEYEDQLEAATSWTKGSLRWDQIQDGGLDSFVKGVPSDQAIVVRAARLKTAAKPTQGSGVQFTSEIKAFKTPQAARSYLSALEKSGRATYGLVSFGTVPLNNPRARFNRKVSTVGTALALGGAVDFISTGFQIRRLEKTVSEDEEAVVKAVDRQEAEKLMMKTDSTR